jgi:type II secretory pathway component PulC
LPSLKLSAIVWYEERSKRFVMVNGLIANEGSVVEGVKVEEIYPDRVRFSHNGRPFEIPIK